MQTTKPGPMNNGGSIPGSHVQKAATAEAIGELLSAADRILVVSHIRPDGDAVGSVLGLGQALLAGGKEVQMVLADGVPANLRHLPGSKLIGQRPKGTFNLSIVLDCSDLKRAGLEGFNSSNPPDINIDHHVTNLNFAHTNLVEPAAVATAEILVRRMPDWGLSLNEPVATALLTGLLTDTLGFRTGNMTATALRVAAELIDYGADLPSLYTEALLQRSYAAVRFWAAGLARLARQGEIVWATLTMKDRQEAGYPGRDDADLINVLSAIEDATVALIFVEQPNGNTKVSWRAKPGVDISAVAVSFGGGGHPAAAGAEIPGGLDEVRPSVLQATQKLLVTLKV